MIQREYKNSIYLFFHAVTNQDEIVTHFDIRLVNKLDHLVNVDIKIGSLTSYKANHALNARENIALNRILYESLEKGIMIHFKMNEINVAHKITAKKLFKNFVKDFIPGSDGYVFRLSMNVPKQHKKAVSDNIDQKTDTILTRDDLMRLKETFGKVEATNEKKSFVPNEISDTLDLHIEKLIHDHKHLSSSEIIELQLASALKHLDLAMHSNLKSLTFIHGIGKGVLKERLFNLLADHPGVLSYNNDYDPRYGYGATFVELI